MGGSMHGVLGANPIDIILTGAFFVALVAVARRRRRPRSGPTRNVGVDRRPAGRPRDALQVIGFGVGVLAVVCTAYLAFHAALAMSSAAAGSSDDVGGLESGPSAAGTFTNSIPIEVPEFHGLEPRVALDYDSEGPNGEAGPGWRLGADSVIVRAGQQHSLPRYDDSDVFVLDGTELVACGSNCVTGGTHETREQSYQRIVYSRDTNSWSRWRPDGVRFDYQVPDTQPVDYQWFLTRVVDTHGNTVTYTHDCLTGHCYLSTIEYASSTVSCGGDENQPACQRGAVVRFMYEPRPDIVRYSTGRATGQILKRLKTVDVRMDDQLLAAYAVTYRVSTGTGSSVLTSFQQFADDATVAADGTVTAGATPPLPPMTFGIGTAVAAQWERRVTPVSQFTISSPPGNPSFPVTETTLPGNVTHLGIDGNNASDQTPIIADFDGDGRADAASWRNDSSCTPQSPPSGSPIRVRLATGELRSTEGTCLQGYRGYAADLDGDHFDDLLLVNRFGGLRPAISQRNGLFTVGTIYPAVPWSGLKVVRQCTVGDINGDDLADFACIYESPGGLQLGIARSKPGGGFTTGNESLPAAVTAVGDVRFALGDVDNSGTQDFMLAVAAVNTNLQLITGYTGTNGWVESWSPTPTNNGPTPASDADWQLGGADFNGDRRTDYVLTTHGDANASSGAAAAALIALSDRGSPTGLTVAPAIAPGVENLTIGDFDGDGKSDILTGYPAGVLRSKGDGTFEALQSFNSTLECRDRQIPVSVAVAADVNGDGQADLLCSTVLHTPSLHFSLKVQPSPVTVSARHRWAVFDDGDGRSSFFYVHFSNPGYRVYTLRAQADGNYVASNQDIAPTADAPLDNPAAEWMPIDVGGPAGAADGKTDLVLVDRADGTLRVTTLMSTGSGWDLKKPDKPWKNSSGTVIFYGSVDVGNWLPAVLNRDGRTDLVHFGPTGGGSGALLEYLLSNGDGTWTVGSGRRSFEAADAEGGPLQRTDVSTFRVWDDNNDGISDFVHIEVGGGPSTPHYTIRTLISTGPASWREESRQHLQSIDSAAAHRLQPADVDGDGRLDLTRPVSTSGCLGVQAYLRESDDWSSATTSKTPVNCQPTGREDFASNVLADVNGDRKTDAYRLSILGNGAYTLLNSGDPGTPWREVAQQPVSITSPDTWAWFGTTDTDGTSGLAYAGATELTTLRWTGPADRVTDIDNGRGALTSISYRAQADARTYLPAGMLPTVVDRITVRDNAYTPAVLASTTFDYADATWSNASLDLIGYGKIVSHEGHKDVRTTNELSEVCGARRAAVETLDKEHGDVRNEEFVQYKEPGSAPFTCLPVTTVTADCELAPVCLIPPGEAHPDAGQCQPTVVCERVAARVTYDAYGNVTSRSESSTAGERRVDSEFTPNTVDYIVDRPFRRATFAPDAGGTWTARTRTELLYDNNNLGEPPGSHGDLTRLVEYSDPANGINSETNYAYDPVGNLTTTISPTKVVTTTIYDPVRVLFPMSTCNQYFCTAMTWNEPRGVVRTVTDANQQTTGTDYDHHGRPIRTTRPDGSTTTIRYLAIGTVSGPDSKRQRIRTETSDGSPIDGVHWREDLVDGLGRVYRTRNEGTTANATDDIVTDTVYVDATALPAAVSTPHRSADPPIWTTYGYDALRRQLKLTHPGGQSASTAEYHVGHVDTTDERGHTTTTNYDALGRIASVNEHIPCAACDGESPPTVYGYDPMDRLTSVTDAAQNTTAIIRDALGRETTMTDPDRGTITTLWRPDGTIDTRTDGSGTHHWTYDDIDRPVTATDTGSTGIMQTHWAYDLDPTTQQPQGFSIGLPTVVTYSTTGPGDGAVTGDDRTFYDALGRPDRTVQCADQTCVEMGYAYDPAGRIKTLAYGDPADPATEHVPYTYDSAGNLTSVGGYLTGVQHDATGQTTQQIYGNGLIEQFTYDPNRLWLNTHTLAATRKPINPLYAAAYTHDENANITALTITQPPGEITSTVDRNYRYDELNRLIYQARGDRPTLLPETYEYDAIGRMTKSPTAGTYQYGDPAHVHAVTSTSTGHQRVYDTAGNLTQLTDPNGRNLQITWTPTGMPQTIADGNGLTSTAYAGDGHRIKRTRTGSNPEHTYYFNQYLEQNGTGLIKYYWAGDQLIARKTPDGNVSYLLQDHLHSTRLVTDQNRTVTAQYDYQPYGKPEPGLSVTNGTSQRWQGQSQDPDADLVYMNARFYDPELGQFTTADSIIPDPYRPQSLNRYGYVEGRPLVMRDPSGHMPILVERKKELQSEPSSGRWLSTCGLFVDCVYYSSGMTVQESYGRDTTSNQYQRRITYTGGLDAEGAWGFGSVTETTIFRVNVGDPNEWSQLPYSTPPLVDAIGDPAEWAQWQPGPSDPPLVRAPKSGGTSQRGSKLSHPAVVNFEEEEPITEGSDFRDKVRELKHLETETLPRLQENQRQLNGKATTQVLKAFPTSGTRGLGKAPLKVWRMGKALEAVGKNSFETDAVRSRIYHLQRDLGVPDARLDIHYKDFYYGPDGRLHQGNNGTIPWR